MKRIMLKDPPLSNIGAFDAYNFGRDLRANGVNPDLLMSSTLFRAQETAHLMFPNKQVFVAPFIKESIKSNLDRSNYPTSIEEQKKKMKVHMNNFDTYFQYKTKSLLKIPNDPEKFMNYVFVNKNPRYKDEKNPITLTWQQAQEINMEYFKQWLSLALNAWISGYPLVRKKIRETNTLVIMVVGHSSFMKKHIGKARDKPNSGGIVQLNFCLEPREESKEENDLKGEARSQKKTGNKPFFVMRGINQTKCKCKEIRTFRKMIHKPELCDGVVAEGISAYKSLKPRDISNC